MSITLSPANLGEAGEAKFSLLCTQAGLVCNKSTRDVTGWDFIVEFPMVEPSPTVALDQRPAMSCHVQLKSTATAIGRVSLKLSAIERIAKRLCPALVIVFLLRADGEGIAGFAIHLLGEELAQVLKRLRDAHARKSFDINNASITFDYRQSGTRFPLTPEGLRVALADACGCDPSRYAIEKHRQLEELGYENGNLEAEALIWVEGPEHLNNILLGLTPVKPERLHVFDSRFGIRIPYSGPLFQDIAELTIRPPYIGECQISIRGADFAPAAIFTAEIYIGPPIEEIGGPQLLIRHPDFTLGFKPDRLEFQTTGDFNTTMRPLRRWTDLIRALSHMAGGHGSITIFETGPFPRFSLPIAQPIEGPYHEQLPQLMLILDGWQRLLNIAGVTSSADFSIEDIWAAHMAMLAVDLLLSSTQTAYFEFKSLGENDSAGSTVDALYFNSAKLGDAGITYCTKVTFQRTDDPVWQYRSIQFTRLDVRPMVDNADEYVSEQAASHGLKIVLDPANVTVIEPAGKPAVPILSDAG